MAAQGTIWVNSVGNYRQNHWEGAWADADGDGFLDVPGHGNDFPVDLIATQRPACDLSASGPAARPPSTTTRSACSSTRRARSPCSTRVRASRWSRPSWRLPDPHDDLAPGFLSAPGTYHLKIMRVGNPPPEHLTLFCRFALPADAQTHGLERPDARRRSWKPLDRRVRRDHAGAGAVLVGGADRRRAPEARPRGTHQRRDHRRVVRRHLVRCTACRRGGGAPARDDAGRERARHAPRLGARRRAIPGSTTASAPGGCASTWTRRRSARRPCPRPGAPSPGVLNLRLPLVEKGTLDAAGLRSTACRSRRSSAPDKVRVRLGRHPPPGRRARTSCASTRGIGSGNAGDLDRSRSRPTTRVRRCSVARARASSSRARLRATAIASDRGSGLAGAPSWRSATARPRRARRSAPLRPSRAATRSRVSVVDRAGNSADAQRPVRVVGAAAVARERAEARDLGAARPAGHACASSSAGRSSARCTSAAPPRRILLGALHAGAHRVTVVAGAARATRLVRVP